MKKNKIIINSIFDSVIWKSEKETLKEAVVEKNKRGANISDVDLYKLPNMGETFFLNIKQGDTPENNQFAKIKQGDTPENNQFAKIKQGDTPENNQFAKHVLSLI